MLSKVHRRKNGDIIIGLLLEHDVPVARLLQYKVVHNLVLVVHGQDIDVVLGDEDRGALVDNQWPGLKIDFLKSDFCQSI